MKIEKFDKYREVILFLFGGELREYLGIGIKFFFESNFEYFLLYKCMYRGKSILVKELGYYNFNLEELEIEKGRCYKKKLIIIKDL